MSSENGGLLELPPGYGLWGLEPNQTPAPGAIYLARMPGDLESLFGSAGELREREFLLEVDGQHWVAVPMPDLRMITGDSGAMLLDTGGINARTNGHQTSIDFQLVRPQL